MNSLGIRPGAMTAELWARVRTTVRVLHLGALVLTLGFSPSTWRSPWRAPLAAQAVRAALPLLPWFALLAAIVSVVLTRIVLVTAQSYGLSPLALEMVVRVLVIELVPLAAAFAVALFVTLPMAGELLALRRAGRLEGRADALRAEIAPRALAGCFTVMLLAAVAGAVALVLAYLMAYGFTPWALSRYTRLVGHIFSPALVTVFALKTLALALAVAVLPIGSALHDRDDARRPGDVELHGLVRLFLVILAVEVLALAGNYL